MSSQGVVEHSASTYMTRNARGKTLIYEFPCSHIIAACHHRCVDFRLFVQGYYTMQSYYDTWEACFIPYSMKMSGLFMMVIRLYLLNQ